MENSLNDLHLSNSMVAALYGHSLVQLEEPEKSSVSKKAPAGTSFKFLGNNLKMVTILVNNPGHTFLPEDELALLTKLLAACQMNAGDVAIVNLAGGKISMTEIFIQLQPSKIISFGKMENAPMFTIEKMNGADLLAAPELKEMTIETAEARQLKSRLWVELKKMFGI
jgi:hypothetical protein